MTVMAASAGGAILIVLVLLIVFLGAAYGLTREEDWLSTPTRANAFLCGSKPLSTGSIQLTMTPSESSSPPGSGLHLGEIKATHQSAAA